MSARTHSPQQGRRGSAYTQKLDSPSSFILSPCCVYFQLPSLWAVHYCEEGIYLILAGQQAGKGFVALRESLWRQTTLSQRNHYFCEFWNGGSLVSSGFLSQGQLNLQMWICHLLWTMPKNEYAMCRQSFDWALCLTWLRKIHVDESFELYVMGSLVPCQVWLSTGSSLGMLVALLSLVDSLPLIRVVFTRSFLTR